jgi:hypothetical protein
MQSLPPLVREALERDRDRQYQAAIQIRTNLIARIQEEVKTVAANPPTQDLLNAVEADIIRYVDALLKTYGDYVSLREYIINNPQESNGRADTFATT